ncbi:hypothetical protein [Arundinibacter roseus]|uniref:Uncharacterized protein n=1 Tax=Arundinibacter roseus TaxID=2070510 RepID=A0A4R4KBA2_9BACT|nr:hypothetical protein [Arundinibacter roseus]TDB63741.1 hypothetical protein EZE20_15720 [Arundinibacter roseus]
MKHSDPALTDAQIDALTEFVKRKYVDYYDVQLELVDHLASEIEQRLAATPALSFDTALQQVYARFGIFGFTEVIEEKAKAVNRKNRHLFWKSVKSLFVLPKIIGTLILTLILFIAFDVLDPKTFLLANGLFALLADGIAIYYFFRKRPRKDRQLLAMQYHNTLHFGLTFNLYLNYYICYILFLPSLSGSGLLLIPAICVVGWISFFGGALAFDALHQEQQKLYPMAFA